jgi:uncharacterized membrane protein YjjP (DUF1212 family)
VGEPPAASVPADVLFLLRLARAGHAAGYTTAELEERLLAIGRAYGLVGVQASVTPTVVDVAVGPLAHQRTYTLRVAPATLDLGTIASLDELVQAVVDSETGAGDALVRLEEIQARPLVRPWWVVLGAYALAGAALAPVIGGGRREAVAAGLVGP